MYFYVSVKKLEPNAGKPQYCLVHMVSLAWVLLLTLVVR